MADADAVHLARFFFFSYCCTLSFSTDGSTKEKKIESYIKYWIRIVYCVNSSTWLVVYDCAYMCGCSKRCENVLFYADFSLYSLSLSLWRCSFYLNNSSRVRYSSAQNRAYLLAERNRSRERGEIFLLFSTNALLFDSYIISIGA